MLLYEGSYELVKIWKKMGRCSRLTNPTFFSEPGDILVIADLCQLNSKRYRPETTWSIITKMNTPILLRYGSM